MQLKLLKISLHGVDMRSYMMEINQKTLSGKKKQRKAAKHPTEYWGSLPAISGTKTKNYFSHYTNP